MKKKIVILLILALVVFVVMLGGTYVTRMIQVGKTRQVAGIKKEGLSVYKRSDLSKYNGAIKGRPILIGLNGYVYDVTEGKKFYEPGGTYHYLAGKDSSSELNLIGGDIIRRKYPIVGVIVD
ncbi:MAG: hypothetical protein UT34_C0002G0225 [candidate division WS6 bacterium GW2011_GWF2_39_15]|uniref:Cytochrome b5 heme-binding domain-containing protein n=1 Tax=candidate division WS6 bacterium GW2011_GWF2_39_15 TaxID=1619100 RepID=A0A0G0MRE5_9BACT|nr:MAG: hypothetical protein UT34_C0002G0225 [candidate division WS6 bacterium GW2011_GWF2_39_15]